MREEGRRPEQGSADAGEANPPTGWLSRARRARAARALERQLLHQRQKSEKLRGSEEAVIQLMIGRARQVRSALEAVHPLPPDPRVLEVGSGAHGLVFYFGSRHGVGVDPLASGYASLFPAWQGRVPTVTASGEALPFPDASFDVVLCDNVIDHAESPGTIVAELARVLRPSGLLYFTVNVHHPVYGLASRLHGLWNALGLRVEVGPFADHTVHLTRAEARRYFQPLPLRIVNESLDLAAARSTARRVRHPGDLLKRVFRKNTPFKLIAIREPAA